MKDQNLIVNTAQQQYIHTQFHFSQPCMHAYMCKVGLRVTDCVACTKKSYLQSTVRIITRIEHLVFNYHTIQFLWLLPCEYSSNGVRTLPDNNSDISHRPRDCRNKLEVKGGSHRHRCCFITVTNIS